MSIIAFFFMIMTVLTLFYVLASLRTNIILVIVFFFSFWPTAQPVTASGMNYSVLLFGVVALISSVYYLVWGKKTFQGPSVDTTMFVQSNETKH